MKRIVNVAYRICARVVPIQGQSVVKTIMLIIYDFADYCKNCYCVKEYTTIHCDVTNRN